MVSIASVLQISAISLHNIPLQLSLDCKSRQRYGPRRCPHIPFQAPAQLCLKVITSFNCPCPHHSYEYCPHSTVPRPSFFATTALSTPPWGPNALPGQSTSGRCLLQCVTRIAVLVSRLCRLFTLSMWPAGYCPAPACVTLYLHKPLPVWERHQQCCGLSRCQASGKQAVHRHHVTHGPDAQEAEKTKVTLRSCGRRSTR